MRNLTRYSAARLILAILFVALPLMAGELIVGIIRGRIGASQMLATAEMLADTGLILCGYIAYVRLIEKRGVTELGMPDAWREAMQGVMLALVLAGVVFGVLGALGAYRITGRNPLLAASPVLLIAICSAVMEEVIMRGVLFRILEESLGTWIAVAISGLLFGVLHLRNPNATWMGAVSIALTAGILLAACFTLTRRLWMAIGLHFGWNFLEGGVFGADVSGSHLTGILTARFTGPELLTGGAFGPEASIVMLFAGFALGAGLLLLARQRKLIRKPWWCKHTAAG